MECFESLEPEHVGHDPSLSQRRLSFIVNRVEIEKTHIQLGSNSRTSQSINILDIPNEMQSSLLQNTTLGSNMTNINYSSNTEEVTMQIECIIHDIISIDFIDYVEGSIPENDDKLNMTYFAQWKNLDFKQLAAFEVMASSFILVQLNHNEINEENL